MFDAIKAKRVYATDINPAAIKNIRLNAAQNGLTKKIIPLRTNIFPQTKILFDLITINPPYTDYQAADTVEKAVFDRDHKTLEYFLKNAKRFLKPNGKIMISWANFADFKLLEKALKKYGYNFKIAGRTESLPRVYQVYELKIKQKVR